MGGIVSWYDGGGGSVPVQCASSYLSVTIDERCLNEWSTYGLIM